MESKKYWSVSINGAEACAVAIDDLDSVLEEIEPLASVGDKVTLEIIEMSVAQFAALPETEIAYV